MAQKQHNLVCLDVACFQGPLQSLLWGTGFQLTMRYLCLKLEPYVVCLCHHDENQLVHYYFKKYPKTAGSKEGETYCPALTMFNSSVCSWLQGFLFAH